MGDSRVGVVLGQRRVRAVGFFRGSWACGFFLVGTSTSRDELCGRGDGSASDNGGRRSVSSAP